MPCPFLQNRPVAHRKSFWISVSPVAKVPEERPPPSEAHHALCQTNLAQPSVPFIFILLDISFYGRGQILLRRCGGIEDDLIAQRLVGWTQEGVIDREKGKLRWNHQRRVALWHRISEMIAEFRSEGSSQGLYYSSWSGSAYRSLDL